MECENISLELNNGSYQTEFFLGYLSIVFFSIILRLIRPTGSTLEPDALKFKNKNFSLERVDKNGCFGLKIIYASNN